MAGGPTAALASSRPRAARPARALHAPELRVEARAAWSFCLQRHGGADGVLRHRGGVLERLLHFAAEGDDGVGGDAGDPRAVVVRVAQVGPDRVLFGARASSRGAAEQAIARMRFALGVDDDLRPFYERFRDDPLIGASVRRRPWLRVMRRPVPFEALAWAICEQLIEFERAAEIERRIVARLGRRCPSGSGLRDAPSATALADVAPAWLQSLDLGGARARTLVRAAREVARGRIDLDCAEHEHGWRRLRAIPGIGPWTVEMLALHGQGRYDQIPAGDLGLLKLVGRRLSGGDPRARAEETQVREFFADYGEWAGLAAVHMMGLP